MHKNAPVKHSQLFYLYSFLLMHENKPEHATASLFALIHSFYMDETIFEQAIAGSLTLI
jgi:hypothetical protein